MLMVTSSVMVQSACYSCFAIDVAGYVIMHETMLEPPLKNSPRKVEDIHITDAVSASPQWP